MADPFLNKINQIILDHLDDEKFGVNELAAEIGLSKSQTFRKVKSSSKKSVNQLIRETRIQEAARLILESDLHASEISYKTGFSSPSYFNKCFRHYYGITPGNFKAKYKDNPPGKNFDQATTQSQIKRFQLVFYGIGIVLLVFGIISVLKNNNSLAHNSTEKISIAVLYFDDHSPDGDKQWFCSAITEEITAKLAGINELLVIGRQSVKKYRTMDQSIPEIAEVLGVDYVIEGSVTMDKNMVKITTQLINSNNEHVWHKEYNETFDNTIDIQQKVAIGIAQQLKIELSPEDVNRIAKIEKFPTENKEAYNLFLQAEYQRNKYNSSSFLNAVPLYEKVIALDSNFVEAYIGLSDILQFGGIVWGLFPEREAWGRSKELLIKGAEIDSTNRHIEYNFHFGSFYYDWDFESMEKYYQTILLNPSHYNLTGVTQDYAMKTGRFEGAFEINDRYVVKGSLISYIYAYKAEILMFQGKKDEAIDLLTTYYPLYSDDLFYLRESTKILFYLGEFEKSRNQLKEIRTKFPDENPSIFIWLDAVFALMDEDNKAAEFNLDQLITRYEKLHSGSPAWFIALYYCYIKDVENTFKWLQKSYDRHEVEMTWLREEPLLIPLRGDNRYKDLYHKIGFSKVN